MNAQNAPLVLTVECFPEYVSGLPMLLAVTVRNVTERDTFLTFEPFDLFDVPGPVRFTLSGRDRRDIVWEAAVTDTGEWPRGIALRPGQSWQALYDLAELHPGIEPGDYRLAATYQLGGFEAVANPVTLRIVAAPETDRTIANALRHQNDRGQASWFAFVRGNWSTPQVAGLSAAGRQRLAYYLFLHRAAYGPQPVAALDPAAVQAFDSGPLQGEAALLRLEIEHAAKGAAATSDATALARRWPGLAWRIEQINTGNGRLTVLRRSSGIERHDAARDRPRPYVDRTQGSSE
jgi:hypothetical protein